MGPVGSQVFQHSVSTHFVRVGRDPDADFSREVFSSGASSSPLLCLRFPFPFSRSNRHIFVATFYGLLKRGKMSFRQGNERSEEHGDVRGFSPRY